MRKVHNALTDLNLETLTVCAPDMLQAQPVTAVLLALGSNYQADYYLPRVRESLAMLGQIQLSTAFQNPDFTATLEQPKPDYTNQCVYISLTAPMKLQQLQQTFKKFESDCNRQRVTEAQTAIKKVTMDIDILLIKTALDKNSLSIEKAFKTPDTTRATWIIMADRYPFKEHERVGIEELILNGFLKE